jgi:Uma2 family endonuclease
MIGPALSIEGDRLRMPSYAWSHPGFRRWLRSPCFPDGVRATYVEGEVFLEMSPESIESHNKVKTAVTAAIATIVEDEDLGEVYSDRALLSHPAAGVSTEPDLMFASWRAFEAGALTLIPRAGDSDFIELEGTVDLVVEIVSDSSVRKDLKELRGGYAAAGIPEYWIIDARGPDLRFEIHLGSDGYQPSSETERQWSGVLGYAFVLRRDRNRAGRWRYRLQTTE